MFVELNLADHIPPTVFFRDDGEETANGYHS